MFDLIANLIDKFLVLVLLGFGLATAVLGMAVLGIGAIVLVANMTTLADRFGDDVLGDDKTTVEQVTGRSGPGQTPTNSRGGTTATTVCNAQQAENTPGSC